MSYFPYLIPSLGLFLSSVSLVGIFYKPCVVMGVSTTMELNLGWLGGTETCFSFVVDSISFLFGLSVMVISSSVLMYCEFYMRGEKHPSRFSVMVLLFVFFMTLFIFMPSGYAMMMGWDGLGVVSFLLVAYDKSVDSISAALVTAIVNRIGDALLILFIAFGLGSMSLRSCDLFFLNFFSVGWLCVLIGSTTKSAQLPFSSWLPAAMAAPTPVSALVHSSTLVTAGVYVMCRFIDYMQGSWFVFLGVVAVMTLVLAGLTASVETDLKKVVAFSTLSQLGMMMLALSINEKFVCVYHLVNHAYFKALMFLCVGSIIYMSCGFQDARFISGLWFKMPVVCSYLILCCFSLVGVPFMAGWYSKEKIVDICTSSYMSIVVVVLLYFSLVLTGFYSFSLLSKMCMKGSYDLSCQNLQDKNNYLLASMTMLSLGAVFSGYVIENMFMDIYSFNPVSFFYKVLTLGCVFSGCFMPVVIFWWNGKYWKTTYESILSCLCKSHGVQLSEKAPSMVSKSIWWFSFAMSKIGFLPLIVSGFGSLSLINFQVANSLGEKGFLDSFIYGQPWESVYSSWKDSALKMQSWGNLIFSILFVTVLVIFCASPSLGL